MTDENEQGLEQQKPEPSDEAAEVAAGGGENGVCGVALSKPEIIAAHAVFGFEMADDGLDWRKTTTGPSATVSLRI